jgi:hypothetical protein
MSSGRGDKVPGSTGNSDGPSETEIQQLNDIAKWTLRESALREQLQKRVSQVEASRREERELRESLNLLSQAFEESRGERYDIISDFTRQYKATTEELIRVVSTTQSTITELKDQQELAKIALTETERERDMFLAMKDKEIEEQNKRIAEMDEEFHIMIDEMQRRMEKKVADAVKAAKHAASVSGGGGGDISTTTKPGASSQNDDVDDHDGSGDEDDEHDDDDE